jgi:hypothetical protein
MTTSFTDEISSVRKELSGVNELMNEIGVECDLPPNSFDTSSFKYTEPINLDKIDDERFDQLTTEILNRLARISKLVDELESRHETRDDAGIDDN